MFNGKKCKSTTMKDLEFFSDTWCLSWILSTLSMITNMRSSNMEFHFPSQATGMTSEHGYHPIVMVTSMLFYTWGGLILNRCVIVSSSSCFHPLLSFWHKLKIHCFHPLLSYDNSPQWLPYSYLLGFVFWVLGVHKLEALQVLMGFLAFCSPYGG
jgi:hypothetical protein